MKGTLAAAKLRAEVHVLLLAMGSPAADAGFRRLWTEICRPDSAEPPTDERDVAALAELEVVSA